MRHGSLNSLFQVALKEGNSNSHGATPVHLNISLSLWAEAGLAGRHGGAQRQGTLSRLCCSRARTRPLVVVGLLVVLGGAAGSYPCTGPQSRLSITLSVWAAAGLAGGDGGARAHGLVPLAPRGPPTLRPPPHTPHPTPCTPHPTPYTLHPTPYPATHSLHPAPHTLYPAPRTPRTRRSPGTNPVRTGFTKL